MRFFLRHSIQMICLISVLQSCFIENAKIEKNQHLIIASDYLFPRDTTLFRGFQKTQNIRVIIKHLNSDSITKSIKNNPTFPGFDILLLKNITSSEKINELKFLHSLKEFSNHTAYPENLSLNYNLVELGIDPFVIIQREDTTRLFRTYNDLHQHKFYARIDQEELRIFLYPLLKNIGKVKTKKWLTKTSENWLKNDSLKMHQGEIQGIFCMYSDYQINILKDENLRDFRKMIFPNQNSSGVMYNSRTIGIVKQCPNYVNALSFIEYYLNPNRNIYLNKRLKTISRSSREPYIRKQRGKFDTFLPYQKIADRLLLRFQF